VAEETNKIAANDNSAEFQPALANTAEVKGAVQADADQLGWLWRKRWWRNAFMSALYFAPKCYLPAGLWTLAGLVMLLGSWQSSIRFGGGGVVSGEALLTSLCIIMCTLMLTLVLTLVSLGMWLICGTAYVRAFMQLDIDCDRSLDRQTTVAVQTAAMHDVSGRKVFLAQFWLIVTLFLLCPFFVMMIGGMVEYLASLPAPAVVTFKLPAWLDMTIMAAIAIATVLFTQLSLVGLAVCSITRQVPFAAAKQSVKLFFRWFVPGFALSILILLVNIVVATPQVIWQIINHENLFVIKGEVIPLLVETVWQGGASIILWTLTGTPICQMLKGQIE
jgi:hypothetical protein